MATTSPTFNSILDCLIDYYPGQLKDIIKPPHQSRNDFFQSMRRDLENLLNTRKYHFSWPNHYDELNKSLLDYGLTDLHSISLTSEITQQNFCQYLAQTILRYEPRLKEINVTLKKQSVNFQLCIYINGILYTEPDLNLITFASTLNLYPLHLKMGECNAQITKV